MNQTQHAILASLAAFVVFAGLNLAASHWLAGVRVDLTAGQLYTLSSSARQVLERLSEPVELELVYSRASGADDPLIRSHAGRVRQMMQEISARSGGRVRLLETDPAPFSEDEERIARAGLTPLRVEAGEPVYLGVIGHNSVDDAITIAFLAPERDGLLEYELVRLISQLDNPEPPSVAVLSSLTPFQLHSSDPQAAFLMREAARSYHIDILQPDFAALADTVDVLMIIHPPPLSERQLYLIDQFLMRRGRALIAIDPAARAGAVQPGGLAPVSSTLGVLETTLGVRLAPDVIADRSLALPVTVPAGGGRTLQAAQPLFIAPTPADMSRSDVVTSQLSRPVHFGAAGHLVQTPGSGLRMEPLIEASAGSARLSPAFAMSDPDPRAVLEAYQPSGERPVLAARLSGPLRSAFSAPTPASDTPGRPRDGSVKTGPDQNDQTQPYRQASAVPAEVIIIADADMFDDRFYVHPGTGQALGDNAAFVLNALDNLSGDAALTALRSRTPAGRPMSLLVRQEALARDRLYAEQRRLEALARTAEERLAELDARPADASGPPATALRDMAALQAEADMAKRALRQTERDYRDDVEALEAQIAALAIWLPPLGVALAGAGVILWRRMRQRGTP